MINTRDICMIAAGAVLGGGIVAAAGYFGVIRQYIPLRDLERELDDVRRQYLEYKHKLEDLHHEPEATEDVEPREDISHGRPASENVPVDDASVDEPSDVDISDESDEEEDEYVIEGPRIEKMLGYTNLESEKGFVFFQNFFIHFVGSIGVRAHGSVHPWCLICHFHHFPGGFQAAACIHHQANTFGGKAVHQFLSVRVKGRVIQMGMGIK